MRHFPVVFELRAQRVRPMGAKVFLNFYDLCDGT